MGSQELFTGSEPPKEETKHSRHSSSKRRADELMENTDQLGRTADAPAIQEKETKGINKRQRGAQKNTKELPALTLHCVVADSPLHPKLRPLPSENSTALILRPHSNATRFQARGRKTSQEFTNLHYWLAHPPQSTELVMNSRPRRSESKF